MTGASQPRALPSATGKSPVSRTAPLCSMGDPPMLPGQRPLPHMGAAEIGTAREIAAEDAHRFAGSGRRRAAPPRLRRVDHDRLGSARRISDRDGNRPNRPITRFPPFPPLRRQGLGDIILLSPLTHIVAGTRTGRSNTARSKQGAGKRRCVYLKPKVSHRCPWLKARP